MPKTANIHNNDAWSKSPKQVIIELVANDARKTWNAERTRNYEGPPFMSPTVRDLLLRRGHIQDCSALPLTAWHIEKHLVRYTGGNGQCASQIRSILGVDYIGSTARFLEQFAKTMPEFVVATLEGRLETAANLVPATGIADLIWEEAMDILEDVARMHLVANMWRAARNAFNRLYAPTGDADLDNNLGAVVTVASAAGRLHSKTHAVTRVLKLEQKARKTFVRGREKESLERLGVVDEARALEEKLRSIYGDGFDAWYEQMIALVRRWTGYIRRSSKVLRDAKSLKTAALHLLHGPSSLPVFYLSALHAVAWVREVGASPSPLRRALEASARCGTVLPPETHKNHVSDARQLFFLLRNTVVRDADAFVRRAARNQPQAALETLVFGGHGQQHNKYEPFKIARVAEAAKTMREMVRDKPFDPECMLVRAEMRGSIMVQLRS